MITKVVNLRNNHNYDVYIGRPSKWGNPYPMNKGRTREVAIRLYVDYIMNNKSLLTSVRELRGKVLGCWCEPKLCHGHVLAYLADKVSDEAHNDFFSYNEVDLRAELGRIIEQSLIGNNLNAFESV